MLTTIIQLLEERLATLFDKLKLSSPTVYLIVLVVVFGSSGALQNSQDLVEQFPFLANPILNEIVTGLVAILLSPRTKRHMKVADDATEGMSVMNIDYDD